jgi:hypothetical protein
LLRRHYGAIAAGYHFQSPPWVEQKLAQPVEVVCIQKVHARIKLRRPHSLTIRRSPEAQAPAAGVHLLG